MYSGVIYSGGMCPLSNMGKKWILEVNFYPFTFIFFLLAQNKVVVKCLFNGLRKKFNFFAKDP